MQVQTSWNRENILSLLEKNDRAVEKAILAIYRRQTSEEQNSSATIHRNGIGFSGAHAQVGTYYAKWLLSGRSLTGKHLDKARKIAKHYVAQLLEEAQNKAAA